VTDQPFHIVFPLFPNLTQLDFTAPHQILSRLPGAKVTVASAAGGEIMAEGLCFAGLTALADIEGCDLICVPGGTSVTDAIEDEVYMREVKRLAAGARYVTSVCTGSLILAAAGLLDGKRAACHWAWRGLLGLFDGVTVDPGRVVRDGNVITGGGVTAGIDFALTVAAEIAGPTVAQALQLTYEYAPAPPFDAGRPETAPAEVLALVNERLATLLPRRRNVIEAAAARLARERSAA
jgi:transcriptional regulator GlxA family with amidase domain